MFKRLIEDVRIRPQDLWLAKLVLFHKATYFILPYCPPHIFSCQVRLCDVQEKMSVAEVAGELLAGQAVAVLQSGPGPAAFLLCAGIKILLMDTGTCSLDRDLSHPGLNPITCAQFNHNGTLVIHAGVDGKLGMTDPNKGELLIKQ